MYLCFRCNQPTDAEDRLCPQCVYLCFDCNQPTDAEDHLCPQCLAKCRWCTRPSENNQWALCEDCAIPMKFWDNVVLFGGLLTLVAVIAMVVVGFVSPENENWGQRYFFELFGLFFGGMLVSKYGRYRSNMHEYYLYP